MASIATLIVENEKAIGGPDHQASSASFEAQHAPISSRNSAKTDPEKPLRGKKEPHFTKDEMGLFF